MERDALKSPPSGISFESKADRAFKGRDADLVRKALAVSSRFYHTHRNSLNVAGLLIDEGADAVTVSAALAAGPLWQGLIRLEDILEQVDQRVAATLSGLPSPERMQIDARNRRRESIRALLSSLDGTPRKVILLVAYRAAALEHSGSRPGEESARMARETLEFYVPLANRLGLGHLRRHLEDSCFRILEPEEYDRLHREVAPIQAEDDECLKILVPGVKHLLKQNGIQGRVQGRTKSLHGIHRKMLRTGRSAKEIMDRIGIRVIVSSVPDCYTLLGLLHAHFKPIPGTFDDYIGLPKDNGYQSLHTCVYPVREISHKPIEIQIRTELMHMEAEHGTAAHWRYKSETATEQTIQDQSQWIRGLIRQHEEAPSAEAFINRLHRQVFQNHLVVFGKGGRIVRLPERATVKSYLDKLNIPAAEDVSVKVNGVFVAIDRPLRDGDSVEVVGNRRTVDRNAKRDLGERSFDIQTSWRDAADGTFPAPPTSNRAGCRLTRERRGH